MPESERNWQERYRSSLYADAPDGKYFEYDKAGK